MRQGLPKTVFVAMSGGVDSSVAAALLQKSGFDGTGIFMRNWSAGAYCTSEEDQESARRAAAKIGIPLYTWDFSKEYKEKVVDYMVEGYRNGETPNPDVMCNKEIKFGLFLEKAKRLGADYIATGHYVRLERTQLTIDNKQLTKNREPVGQMSNVRCQMSLHAARDSNKDQSYFLWTLTQKQLAHCLFPIGDYTKPEVRRMAREFGLPNADRKDSQGLCFVGKVDFPQFLASWIPERRGAIVTTAGRAVGEHQGVQFYTIGQRRGLGIGGGTPYFVVAKDASKNVLTVAPAVDDAPLWQKELIASNVSWISGKVPAFPLRCMVRIRYRQALQACTLSATNIDTKSHEISGTSCPLPDFLVVLRVVFDQPQRAVAPGQSVVFYLNEDPSSPSARSGRSSDELRMLGGGVICAGG